MPVQFELTELRKGTSVILSSSHLSDPRIYSRIYMQLTLSRLFSNDSTTFKNLTNQNTSNYFSFWTYLSQTFTSSNYFTKMHLSIPLNATVTVYAGSNAIATFTSTPEPTCQSDCWPNKIPLWKAALISLFIMMVVITPLAFLLLQWSSKRDKENQSEAREARETAADVELDSMDPIESLSQAMHLFLNPGLGSMFDTISRTRPVASSTLSTIRPSDHDSEEAPPPYSEPPPYFQPRSDFGRTLSIATTIGYGQVSQPEAVHTRIN